MSLRPNPELLPLSDSQPFQKRSGNAHQRAVTAYPNDVQRAHRRPAFDHLPVLFTKNLKGIVFLPKCTLFFKG
jgi:hypothetical protein